MSCFWYCPAQRFAVNEYSVLVLPHDAFDQPYQLRQLFSQSGNGGKNGAIIYLDRNINELTSKVLNACCNEYDMAEELAL